MKKNDSKLIQEYWNNRAKGASMNGDSPQATTDDIYLRNLEATVLDNAIKSIKKNKIKVLDIGCGDGLTTCRLSQNDKIQSITGIDYSEEMIEIAIRRKAELKTSNLNFQVGNVLELVTNVEEKFDLIITNRCLINLESWEDQKKAIEQIYDILELGGSYFATENFLDGQNNMNSLRKSIGLSEIPVRWHNLFYDESQYIEYCSSLFKEIIVENFASSYYYITRGVYSKLCNVTGEIIDYNNKLHEIAIDFPSFGNFSPLKFVKHLKS